ncbi:MAG: CinA family nicotinamide mononucleotide deamidase-related protein [Deferribacterales bacterium]|nr:CinA family nicotinamide mononucleotide deamidase-related protein [Deferribacterales bacterium]
MGIACAVLAVGSELLEGSVTDTNSGFIGDILSSMGIKPLSVRLIPDDKDILVKALKEAARDYPLVVLTGGLGPTFDDITSQCIAIAAGVKTEVNHRALERITEWLKELNVPLCSGHYHQAELPIGCDIFENTVGTAHGFGINIGSSYVVAMPGVPAEMTVMFKEQVVPFIKSHFECSEVYRCELHFGLIAESEIDKFIKSTGIPKGVECIINAGKSEIAVKIRSVFKDVAFSFGEKIAEAFPESFMGYGAKSPAHALSIILKNKGKSISCAESCTGGYIGKVLTEISGISEVFYGGIISYSNHVKVNLLGVKEATLEKYGAVSEETAAEMALGVTKATGSHYGISVTGIAGPNGGSDYKPVGTVYIGVSDGKRTLVRRFKFNGNRENVRQRSVNAALFLAYTFIRDCHE